MAKVQVKNQCTWSLKWGTTPESVTRCERDVHLTSVTIRELPDKRFSVETNGDPHHTGPGLPQFPYQKIDWEAGDRREWQGDYPGQCHDNPAGCTLPRGHHGRHAP